MKLPRWLTVLLLSVSAATVLLALGLWISWPYRTVGGSSQVSATQQAPREVFDQFADFNYARKQTRAQVFAMLGPPTETDPRQEGFAECCTWRASFGPPLLMHDYRLTLSFASNGEVVAGGLYVDGKAQTP